MIGRVCAAPAWFAALVLLAGSPGGPAAAEPAAAPAQRPADLVLTGELTGADHQRYRMVPFETPPGVTRLTVRFDHDGRDQKTVVDLGLFDGERFRGWSGGSKSEFTLSAEATTPSFLPGTLRPGRWSLLLGMPNVRPASHARYTARLYFDRSPVPAPAEAPPLRPGPGWYRGDLHMHTGHSDGTCLSQSGVRVPCPVYRTVEAAAAAGLDFIAVTDHNTTSQADALRELQPAFDRLLLIPGREITTFQGHANLFGPTGFVDFRLGDPAVPDADALLRAAAASGGVLSINHPATPSGEACMGCGWTAAAVDYRLVQAVEVVNGGTLAQTGAADGPFSGLPFWEARLNEGVRLTAVGGSDNHDPGAPRDRPSAVGRPTTAIWARDLSVPALLDGLRAGRAFVDVDGTRGRMIELSGAASSGRSGPRVAMGGDLAALAGARVRFEGRLAGVEGGRIEAVLDGRLLSVPGARGVEGEASTLAFDWRSDGRRHWLRLNGRDARGRLVLIGNPIYVNFPPRDAAAPSAAAGR
ncbi:CehA/McbA family metallohydrolase [Caulobacter sp. CCUG 60055]|uniref:CehA/McbA family metallohydrolase n=1 Tax=Caulobacter sp. CCUG 60055 TaxID=2100090 RepID=UPI001FA71AEB|nr:CehA/McbA family metallohydrolase [Caulobacter sp. CCUG 60055]